ncbi:MAG: isocitrate lyase/phosphoenolpyruvate mutase family protein, partial [Pseudonocardiaceae bacterium]
IMPTPSVLGPARPAAGNSQRFLLLDPCTELIAEVCGQVRVDLDRGEVAAALKQPARRRAVARPDLQHVAVKTHTLARPRQDLRAHPVGPRVRPADPPVHQGRDAGIDFVLNARTDVFLRAAADRGELLPEAIRRGKACLDAGAPVVFVPGVVAREEIRVLVKEFGPQRLSVISVPGASLPVRKLQKLGVARVSTGPFTQRVALTALQDTTAALLAGETLPERTRALN